MRIIPFIISLLITVVLVFALNNKWGAIPPLGKFLSPQQGFWQNADPADEGFNADLNFKNLKGKVTVYLDERLVPHVFAEDETDVYFVQGFLHAKFRLWQMEFQTFAAAGRVSEHLGNDPRFIHFDREQRRLGMTYAAENALKEMEANPETRTVYDAYSAGVNAYINSLSESSMPLEYKLLNYKPEQWTNLKCALFLKQMSKVLAGFDRDLELTNVKSAFSLEDMAILFPQVPDSLVPIVPKGTLFEKDTLPLVVPPTADSLYFGKDTTIRVQEINKANRNNGSNNWAVSGLKTATGAPILCNDPHLELSLPSIWYEMQLTTPTLNTYGATFPGTPSVIIGYNDSISFGFTNAQRDVKDYYKIKFRDGSKKEYWYNNEWQPTQLRMEQIKVAGGADVLDTVAYTVFGPVMYDHSFTNEVSDTAAIALRWTAHDPSNEGLMWLKLDRAKNYDDYYNAIKDYATPGQNMLFASTSGDIALWQQAKFPARWQEQGMYLKPGEDSTYQWQHFIPQSQNPHVVNPAQGFIESANQRPVDSTYPYFIPGNYITARGITISSKLEQMQQITPQDMMALQNNTFSSFAQDAVPLLMKYTNTSGFEPGEIDYYNRVRNWDFDATSQATAPTIFQAWIDTLEKAIWVDEFAKINGPVVYPDEQTMLELMLRDSTSHFIDDINTPEIETLEEQVTRSFKIAAAALVKEEKVNGLVWWKHKNPSIYHLLKTILPFARTGLPVGGWNNTINAVTQSHGPSWRMIVQMTRPIVAYGVYPGGQSGNPGSHYYDSFIDTWAAGKYYTLWMMKESEENDSRIKWKMTFTNS